MEKTYRVLLVDDSSDDRFFLRLLLERTSKFVIVGEARDGEEAIDYLGRQEILPDLVLLDLKMPGKNGFDVLDWIRAQKWQNLKVAIMSGSWLPEDIAHSAELGAHGYFKKTSMKNEQQEMIDKIELLLRG